VKSCYNRCLKYAFSVVNQRNKNKTPEALENAIESLGASINAYTDGESIYSIWNYAKTIRKPCH
jgi:hypothetical protein